VPEFFRRNFSYRAGLAPVRAGLTAQLEKHAKAKAESDKNDLP
jgi:hypothetical protein